MINTLDDIIREMAHCYVQVQFYRKNEKVKPLPKKLSEKIKYLTGYAKAIRILQQGKTASGESLENLVKRLQEEHFKGNKR